MDTATALPFGLDADRFLAYLAQVGAEGRELPPAVREALALCAACQERLPGAWEALDRRMRPFLQATFRALGASGVEAEDLAADLLVRVVEKGLLTRYSGLGSFEGWLRMVASRRYLDERRLASSRRVRPLEGLPAGVARAPEEDGCERHFSYGFLSDIAGRLAGALQELPERRAFLVNLYFFQEWTLAEVAGALGVHESTACRWKEESLRQLRSRLEKHLRNGLRWSRGEVVDFIARCLPYLSARLGVLRRS